MLRLLLITFVWALVGCTQAPADPIAPKPGQLRIDSAQAVTVEVNGQPWDGQPLSAGTYRVRLSAPGLEPMTQHVRLEPGQLVTLRGDLPDITAPTIVAQAHPTISTEGQPVAVALDLNDPGWGLAYLTLYLGDEVILEQPLAGNQIETALDLWDLPAGLHRLEAVVRDTAGNTASHDWYIEVNANTAVVNASLDGALPGPGEVTAIALPTPASNSLDLTPVDLLDEPEPTPTAPPTPVSTPLRPDTDVRLTVAMVPAEVLTVTGNAEQQPVAFVPPSETIISRAASVRAVPIPRLAWTETLTIPTYDYEAGLSYDGPRPTLDVGQMGPLAPRPYEAVILQNDALRLTFLPQLGGRLYQITDRSTGEPLLYNNSVIKPTRWGPEDMTWWLAAGGMEWAFPVYEHGYAWASTWAYTLTTTPDWTAITLHHIDEPTQLAATVVVSLPVTGTTFSLNPSLVNQSDSTAYAQLWVNAAVPGGPGQQVELPAESVRVHSAGELYDAEQVLAWESSLAGWIPERTWFGAFAAPTTGNTVRAQGAGSSLWLERRFDPAHAPGVKVFTWGPLGPMAEYEGAPYVELWGGLTQDFATATALEPGQRRGWAEWWTVGGPE